MHLWCRTVLSPVRSSGEWKPLQFGKGPNHWVRFGCVRSVTRGRRNSTSPCRGQHTHRKGISQLGNAAEHCSTLVSSQRGHTLQTLLPFLTKQENLPSFPNVSQLFSQFQVHPTQTQWKYLFPVYPNGSEWRLHPHVLIFTGKLLY